MSQEQFSPDQKLIPNPKMPTVRLDGPNPHRFVKVHPVMTDLIVYKDGKGEEHRTLVQHVTGASETVSLEKKIGDPCPTCELPLERRRSSFRTIVGDVAYCRRCCSSFEIAGGQPGAQD